MLENKAWTRQWEYFKQVAEKTYYWCFAALLFHSISNEKRYGGDDHHQCDDSSNYTDDGPDSKASFLLGFVCCGYWG